MIDGIYTITRFSLPDQFNADFFLPILIRLVTILLVLSFTWLVARIISSLIRKGMKRFNPKAVLQLSRIATWSIWFIGLQIVLNLLGLGIDVLLTITVLGGLVLIVGFRDILPSFVARDVITTNDLFKIGDWIEIGEHFGRVVSITWTDTVLMTRNNEAVHIPNSVIVRNALVNRTVQGGTRISVPMIISRDIEISEIERILLGVASELGDELVPDYTPEFRVTDLRDESIMVELLVKIVNPARDQHLASEIRKNVIKRLGKTG